MNIAIDETDRVATESRKQPAEFEADQAAFVFSIDTTKQDVVGGISSVGEKYILRKSHQFRAEVDPGNATRSISTAA
ncbi:MAG: hypothetical protein WA354_05240 [Terracidiphilus sp.]